jgi:putative ABC transport system permease protein
LPFGLGNTTRLTLAVPGQQGTSIPANGIGASESLLKTLGVPILRGRSFDERDGAGAPPVVILSEFAARKVFGTVEAVGRQLLVQGQQPRPDVAIVVGVTRDTDVSRLLRGPGAFVYRPLAQHRNAVFAVVVRSRTDSDRAVLALRQALRRVDPDLAVESIGTGRSILSGPYEFLRAAGITALALGGLTLGMAMVGLFGIQSHSVAHRTREIGVRMSFGASAAQIRTMVLRDGGRPVLEGMAIGVLLGVAGRMIVRAQLGADGTDMSVIDPWMLLVVPIPLILAGFCACYLPAQKAAGVDPIIALRHD